MMLFVISISDDVLEQLEKEGGLKKDTISCRERVYNHFSSYYKAETNVEIEDSLKTETGCAEFEKAFGR